MVCHCFLPFLIALVWVLYRPKSPQELYLFQQGFLTGCSSFRDVHTPIFSLVSSHTFSCASLCAFSIISSCSSICAWFYVSSSNPFFSISKYASSRASLCTFCWCLLPLAAIFFLNGFLEVPYAFLIISSFIVKWVQTAFVELTGNGCTQQKAIHPTQLSPTQSVP